MSRTVHLLRDGLPLCWPLAVHRGAAANGLARICPACQSLAWQECSPTPAPLALPPRPAPRRSLLGVALAHPVASSALAVGLGVGVARLLLAVLS